MLTEFSVRVPSELSTTYTSFDVNFDIIISFGINKWQQNAIGIQIQPTSH